MPVSMTRKILATPSALAFDHAQLPPDAAQIALARLEREARDVARRRVAVRTVASGHVVAELARAAGGAERHALVDDRLELVARHAVVDHPPFAVERHLLDPRAPIVDQVAAELDPTPLIARGRREVIHQRSPLRKET